MFRTILGVTFGSYVVGLPVMAGMLASLTVLGTNGAGLSSSVSWAAGCVLRFRGICQSPFVSHLSHSHDDTPESLAGPFGRPFELPLYPGLN